MQLDIFIFIFLPNTLLYIILELKSVLHHDSGLLWELFLKCKKLHPSFLYDYPICSKVKAQINRIELDLFFELSILKEILLGLPLKILNDSSDLQVSEL